MDAGSLEVRHRANVLSVLSGFLFFVLNLSHASVPLGNIDTDCRIR